MIAGSDRASSSAGVDAGFWSWDRATGRVVWDEQLERLFGLAPGTFEQTFEGWSSRLHPDDRALVTDLARRAMETESSLHFVHRCVWPDGSIHWLECLGGPTSTEGHITGLAGVVIASDPSHREPPLDPAQPPATNETGATMGRLHALAVRLAGAATVAEVAETLVREGAAILGADGGFFSVVEEEQRALVLQAHHGARTAVIEFYRNLPLDVDTPATFVATSGTPVYVSSHDDRRTRFPDLEDQGAAAFVVYPVAVGGFIQAVLAFGFREPHQFTADEKDLIATLVEMSTQALQRAALHDARDRAAARASQLESITSDLAGAISRQAVARVVVDHLLPGVGAQKGSLFLFDETSQVLRALAIMGYPEEYAAELETIPLDRPSGPTEAFLQARPLVIDGFADFQERWPRLAETVPPEEFPETSVMLPLIVDGKPIGTIGISYDTKHLLTDDEMRHLTIMAGICAQALGRADAFESSEAARQRLRAVDQISDAALSQLSLEDLLHELPGRITAALACEAVRIFLLDEDGGTLVVRGHHGSPGDDLAEVPLGRGLAGTIAATGNPRVIEDISRHEVITPAFPDTVVSEAGVPLRSGGEVIGVLDVGAGPERPLTVDDLELLELAADRIAAAIDRGRAFELERTARRQSDLIARLAEIVNRPGSLQFQFDEMLRLLQMAVADWGLAYLTSPDIGTIVSHSSLGDEPPPSDLDTMEALVTEVSPTLADVIEDGRRRIIDPPPADDPALRRMMEQLAVTTLLAVPLQGAAEASGLLLLGRSGRPFLTSEILLVDDFTGRMSAALQSRLVFERHRNTAMTLQRSLLPAALPEIPGLEIAARYWPASEAFEVGGDFYDVIPIDSNRWGVIVGDVSGKGISASAMTGVARHTARAAARHGIDPVDVLRWIHDAFHEQVQMTEVFCTAAFGLLERTDDGFDFRFAVGGHPLPIHIAAAGARFVGTPGTVLGLVDNVTFTETRVHLEAGDWLIIYTDGVTDVPAATAVTEEELLEIVVDFCRTDCHEALEAFDRLLKERYGDVYNRDDTAVLVIRCSDLPNPESPS